MYYTLIMTITMEHQLMIIFEFYRYVPSLITEEDSETHKTVNVFHTKFDHSLSILDKDTNEEKINATIKKWLDGHYGKVVMYRDFEGHNETVKRVKSNKRVCIKELNGHGMKVVIK